ncbi:ASPIC/UnbV domain protein [Allomuricauda ruestringensis DSM 13258]|uniref:ASPIC/UnbV domain protein n=1 Tax=Allomuricauda ruestringensis (strain DSM 13258 / CIP 107369 / LMG 19739 / B1) TaxID=886377 RepID=G2PS17_ALLRU|nr:VCBS repeat-containing protein [Allomuricauda ruestringensis]AEM69607.1 ASPIC/UnbV domain protein [Allomuricauda ruestringensis DSM 13258]
MKKIITLIVIYVLIFSCQNPPRVLFKQLNVESTGIYFNNKIVETDSFNILTNEYIFNGGGVAVADFNNDGKSDILFTGNQVANQLYLNEGDFKFKEVGKDSGIGAENNWCTGVAVVDINLDGWLDAYVCTAMKEKGGQRRNLLFVNQGSDKNGVPKFREMAAEYGIDDSGNSMNATFFDYDKDGFLDLYVLNNQQVHTLPSNYRPKIDDGSAKSNDRLYHNNGNGIFSDVTIEAGIVHEGFGLGLAVSDLNYDGWPDIHVSNDYLTNDLLYINNGDGTFTNQIEDYIKHQSKFSMGSDIADYDNDGLLDIITLDMLGESNQRMKTTIGRTNYLEYTLNERFDYQYQYMRNMLHKGSSSGGDFSEIGLMAGVSKTDWSWAPLFVDVDNDGFRDLLITNGFPRDITDRDFGDFRLGAASFLTPAQILDSIPVVKIPNYGYRNKGDWTFEEVGNTWGLNVPSFSNGAAYADLDLDGDLDYVVNNINEEAFIFKNQSESESFGKNNFLRVLLKGNKENPLAIGAKVLIRYGKGQKQYYQHYLSRGYMSSMEPIVHFGIGSNEMISELEIHWPDGNYNKMNNIQPNQLIEIDYETSEILSNADILKINMDSLDDRELSEVSDELGINYKHVEQDFVDFNTQQRTLPHKFSQHGPCLAVGDINGDSYDDVIVGSSANHSPVVYIQNANGNFEEHMIFDNEQDMGYEEVDMELFDLENDGDLDLYMVSGSNEFEPGSEFYKDRILINDGHGNFVVDQDRMPEISTSGSVVKSVDFDKDGYLDLFVGGRTPAGKYPAAEKSYLLKNDKGILKDVTREYAPDLHKVGMVTDAIWSDYDGDNRPDLIVLGEYMPITFFKNETTSFKIIKETGIDDYIGWWECIKSSDMDGDGDIDFVAGNLGSNNFFQPSKERPVHMVGKDFDKNGSQDPICFVYIKDDKGTYKPYPFNYWGDLNLQSPLFRKKFDYFKEYAEATLNTLFSEEEIKNALILKGNFDKSAYLENLGNGKFNLHQLPAAAQLAPLNDILLCDMDGDGHKDILGIGNDFGNETFIGRYDALNGIFLKGNGQGDFISEKTSTSGFLVPGDAKSIVRVNHALGGYLFFVTQNKDKLLVFKGKTNSTNSVNTSF